MTADKIIPTVLAVIFTFGLVLLSKYVFSQIPSYFEITAMMFILRIYFSPSIK